LGHLALLRDDFYLFTMWGFEMCGKVLMFLEGIQKVSFFPYAFQLFHSFYVPTWQLSESTEPEFGNEVVHVYAEKRKSQRWWHKRSIWCFSDRALDYRLVSNYQLNAQFLYSITIYMLYDNPRHVSSSTMHIFRRTNCIITASGIVTLCRRPYSLPVESGHSKKSMWWCCHITTLTFYIFNTF